jgi:hypothetical protein
MYNWLVFAHVLFAFLFMLAHGVHAAAMLKIRGEADPARALTYFNMIPQTTLMRWLTVLLGLPAFAAAYLAGWWTKGWIWASFILFVIISWFMVRYGSSYFGLVEKAAARVVEAKKAGTAVDTAVQSYDAARSAPHTLIVSVVGLLGLAMILWLMRFKPF